MNIMKERCWLYFKKLNCSYSLLISFLASLILFFFHLTFKQYFSNINDNLGHDYGYFLPLLLNGYYWYKQNGFFELPWFTPSFCGGIPYLPNPQTMYYSIPQFLSFYLDPLSSIYLTFILFAIAGFAGFYFLLKIIFKTSSGAALLGSTIYLFNGFYIHRMIIGHLTYHSFMLIPFVAFFLLRSYNNDTKNNNFKISFDIVIAGILISYMMNSGAGNFVVPSLICLVGIWFLLKIYKQTSINFWMRISSACVLAFCLSATKIISGLYYLSNFPRTYYPLPGIEGFFNTLIFVLKIIFIPGSSETAAKNIVNFPFILEQHEFEFGITYIPLLIIVVSLTLITFDYAKRRVNPLSRVQITQFIWLIPFISILFLPIILNMYYQDWNSLLKSIPYIKSSSSLFRWIGIEIPLVILCITLIVESIKIYQVRFCLVIFGVIGVVTVNMQVDRTYYNEQLYNPDSIIMAHYAARDKDVIPGINNIGVDLDEYNQYRIAGIGGNDLFVFGISQLACNEAIFGYKLDKFPTGMIRPGSVMEEKDGNLNIRNPACYVFGDVNNCEPGDHFITSQKEMAQAFTNYKPFPFEMPYVQKIANKINSTSLVLTIIFIIFCGYKLRNNMFKSFAKIRNE